MDRIEVVPRDSLFSKKGWHWRCGREKSKGFNTRQEAFEDALIRRETESIVLLREDGTLVGELYHAESPSSGPPQRVDLLAASTRDHPVSLND